MSSLRDSRAKKLASHQAKKDADPSQTNGAVITEKEKMLGLLNQHRSKFSQIQGREKRNELKATVVGEYDPYLDGLLIADEGGQDPVVTTLMVWNLDIGQYDRALELATYAMVHDLVMPAQFDRDLPTVVAGELSDAYFNGGEVLDHHLASALDLLKDSDMPDKVSANLHKAYGSSIEADNQEDALHHYTRALALNPKITGVKKAKSDLEKRISEQADADA